MDERRAKRILGLRCGNTRTDWIDSCLILAYSTFVFEWMLMKKKIALGFSPIKPQLFKMDDVLTFGKHKGKTVEWILEHAPSYLVWLDDEKIAKISNDIYNMAEQYSFDDEDFTYPDPFDMWGDDD